MKFCVDCTHFQATPASPVCLAHPYEGPGVNLVTGAPVETALRYHLCSTIRGDERCGLDALHFSPRPPPLCDPELPDSYRLSSKVQSSNPSTPIIDEETI